MALDDGLKSYSVFDRYSSLAERSERRRSKVRDGVLGLGLAAYLAVSPLVSGCKKGSPVGPGVPQSCVVDFYHNISAEKLGSKSYVKEPGDVISGSISGLGFGGLDDDWFACFSNGFNRLRGYGGDGRFMVEVDDGVGVYNVVLFPELPEPPSTAPDGLSYGWVLGEADVEKLDWRTFREDKNLDVIGSYIPEEDVDWRYVIAYFDNVLRSKGIRNGSVSVSEEGGDFSHGYRVCRDGSGKRVYGSHSDDFVAVDPGTLANAGENSSASRRAIMWAELFERLILDDDIGGKPSSYTIQSRGEPNLILDYFLHAAYTVHGVNAEDSGGVSFRFGFGR